MKIKLSKSQWEKMGKEAFRFEGSLGTEKDKTKEIFIRNVNNFQQCIALLERGEYEKCQNIIGTQLSVRNLMDRLDSLQNKPWDS